ncbi:unnamed protein product [Calypogeia fissa]
MADDGIESSGGGDGERLDGSSRRLVVVCGEMGRGEEKRSCRGTGNDIGMGNGRIYNKRALEVRRKKEMGERGERGAAVTMRENGAMVINWNGMANGKKRIEDEFSGRGWDKSCMDGAWRLLGNGEEWASGGERGGNGYVLTRNAGCRGKWTRNSGTRWRYNMSSGDG